VRRVFQALRIAVNDEFSALETFCASFRPAWRPGGRVAVLTFHSGEDRRVKKSFEAGRREGVYAEISGVLRPGAEERRANPRCAPAKLRWARRSDAMYLTGLGTAVPPAASRRPSVGRRFNRPRNFRA